MDIIVDLFYAIMFFGMWFGIIKYRRIVKSWTGNFVWAEQFIWRGWTYFVMLLLWLFLMFLWVLWPFGGMDVITWWSSVENKYGNISK